MNDVLRVGIGGPVGSGKTRLVEMLVPELIRMGLGVAVITNDLVTDEDAQRVRRSGVIDPHRVLAVETGACPHTAIREDPSANLAAARRLQAEFDDLDLILIESGGDNLAATFTSDLVDYWIFVIDTAGGDDIPRKKGIGLLQADLLVVNKIDLAEQVGADLDGMRRDCAVARPVKPTVFTDLRSGTGLGELTETLLRGTMLTAASR
ncbi:urease accessory protein UreG [Mycolicibacterium smegmatis]|jgi:urease accessory protein|uniref:Urease accessory protein UreG n=1 Tax=Mycolicibacterium smegmatis (strain MKD8) TaxID=1214915 RepID=A0A2U9PXM3_MYCSE|nr:urease accessory protein UreG [Mycolicibacterium smegmatis]AWT56560.1 urease accessory protein UreG [Mycolicibacterium smegmatis MKD8]MCP2624058.1 urease accessory protein UreG [Mycolicibacterium smegmatis]UGU28368.1 urease accessory protein UreG [Mycolicibacterium smegmatis]ULN69371.1 urease accessory protein UreG [Mycolicibacterium smegmatis]